MDPTGYGSATSRVELSFSVRLVLAVKNEWTTAADSLKFWSLDYGDDKSDKLALMEIMSAWCFKCSPPKVELLYSGCLI